MMRNNTMFQEDQVVFYRKKQERKQLKVQVPKMERFFEF